MENSFHEWLRRSLPPSAELSVPIGDDAAVLRLGPDEQVVVAADTIMDGVHFRLETHGGHLAGRKALAVNLSDMAAMAARPVAATIALSLPRAGAETLAREILDGAAELAEKANVAICGGDTNCWDHPLSISVTLIGGGDPARLWRRSGGRIGDALVVTGPLGGSLLGRHLTFPPKHREAILWRDRYAVNAAMDITDGLCLDASRLASASGLAAILFLDQVPIAADAHTLAQESGRSPLEHALRDGEDFELLMAMPLTEAQRFCRAEANSRIVGELNAGSGLFSKEGEQRTPLSIDGYQHGAG